MFRTKIVLWCAGAALVLAGCSKDATGPDHDDDVLDYGTVTAVVNGHGFRSTDPQGHRTARGVLLLHASGDTTFHLLSPCWGSGDTIYCGFFVDVAHPAVASLPLNENNRAWWQVSRIAGADTLNESWTTDADHRGSFVIATLDTLGKKATGTFAFEAMRPDSGTVVDVTNGRFDVPYEVEHVTPLAAGRR